MTTAGITQYNRLGFLVLLPDPGNDLNEPMTSLQTNPHANQQLSTSKWLMLRKHLVVAAAVMASASPGILQAELIPENRRIDWKAGVSVGVPGGIATNRTRLIDVTSAPYNADKTGGTSADTAIQAAINAASSGDVVYIPRGRYLITRPMYINHTRDGISVRGAGADSTILDARVNTVFVVGSNSDYQWRWPSGKNTISAGLIKGSTAISIPDTSAFSIGQIIQIAVDNQNDSAAIARGATPTISTSGYPKLRRQLSKIVSKTNSSLNIFPPIFYTPDASLQAQVNVAQFQTDGVGIEDLSIDGSNGPLTFGITFEQCHASWVKGVKITHSGNYGIYFTNSLNCEVRQCVVSDRKTFGSNGAGILTGNVSACLFEDNIVLNYFPAFEINQSSTGNVIAYNLMENPVGGTLNTNHGPHNSFNLYEGNVTPNIQSDGYFGSASDDTLFRNWIHGTNSSRTLRTFIVALNRFTRNYTIIGNVLGESGTIGTTPYSFGNPNMGNSMYSGTTTPSEGSFWRDWNATASIHMRSSDTAGTIQLNSGTASPGQLVGIWWGNGSGFQSIPAVSAVSGDKVTWTSGAGTPLPVQGTTVQVYFGPAGYQELDLDVERTTVLKANYFFASKSIPTAESIGSDSLPNSLFRDSKPDWFGDLAWPPFDPFNPTAATFTSIPAGYRYLNGSTPPPSESTASAPANVKIRILQ